MTASIPYFEAWYGAPKGIAMRPPIELRKTMRPRALRTSGSIACVTPTWAIRLTSS